MSRPRIKIFSYAKAWGKQIKFQKVGCGKMGKKKFKIKKKSKISGFLRNPSFQPGHFKTAFSRSSVKRIQMQVTMS